MGVGVSVSGPSGGAACDGGLEIVAGTGASGVADSGVGGEVGAALTLAGTMCVVHRLSQWGWISKTEIWRWQKLHLMICSGRRSA